MQPTRLTDSTRSEQGVSAINGATLQRPRRWETAYTAVCWDYPPSPAEYHDALLSRGASHSRFLRIAYLSTRERYSTPPSHSPLVSPPPTSTVCPLETSSSPLSRPCLTLTTHLTSPAGSPRKLVVRLPPIPLYPLSRPCVNLRSRATNPTSHTLKRRKPQWPKPPHYHASLLRSPLSHRKGLFRAILPPSKAVDFFQWDVLLGADVSSFVPRQKPHRMSTGDVDACASLHVAESVLEPYEAAAGFFGWHGLGLDVIRRMEGNHVEGVDEECCWSEGIEVCRLGLEHDGASMGKSSDLQLDIDEAVVDQARARWARTAEELVGPPGLALRWVVEDGRPGKPPTPSDPVHRDVPVSRASQTSSRREEVRWDPDTDSSPSHPERQTFVIDKERQPPSSNSIATASGPYPNSKPELQTDSSSAWWYEPSSHRGPPPTPYLPPLRFPPPPSVQYGPPPLQFSPWFPGGRVASAQGHGYWYNAQPIGAPSCMTRDLNLSKSLSAHSHVFSTPVTPTSMQPSQCSLYPIKPSLGQDKYGPCHDCDRETETDHGYESTTTTTDSDPLPHTPIGAATTSHCIEELQVHGDDEAEAHGIEINAEHAAVTIGLSDPTTPVKVLGRFSMSTLPSVSSHSPGSDRDGYGSSKAAVVFPSLNGSFCQGSLSHMSASPFSQGMSARTTPASTVMPVCSSSPSSAKGSPTQPVLDGKDISKTKLQSGDLEPTSRFGSSDNPALLLSLCSPPLTSPNSGLRKDSQGFWEPVTPLSPSSSSSSSSLPLSQAESKTMSRRTTVRIDEKTGPVLGESSELSQAASSQFTPSSKSRSLSPGPRRVTSAGPSRSSVSRPASFSSPTYTPASASVFSGSYPSSPSPSNSSSLVPSNPTTLLPAFLATTSVKRKKASRTREIVDRLRTSSVDAGEGGVGLDSLGRLASPSVGGELVGTLVKASSESDHAAGNHIARNQPSPSPPPTSNSGSASWPNLGKNHDQTPGSKSSKISSSRLGGKGDGATQVAVMGSDNLSSLPSPRTATTTAKTTNITPFPILNMPQTSPFNFAVTQLGHSGRTTGREPVTATPSGGGDGSKMNATVVTFPNARSSGPQHLSSTPNGGTSPSTHPSHHPLPSPSHPAVHPQPPLGAPPPMLAVSPCPHPMYVPFAQYHLAPPHQSQQGQGTWLAVYPSRPPHLPVHPLPAPTHVSPITGASGMRHVSW